LITEHVIALGILSLLHHRGRSIGINPVRNGNALERLGHCERITDHCRADW
jgi:hypothetical protein